MPEYIEREAAIELLSQPITMSMCLSTEECHHKIAQQRIDRYLIENIPAADVRPVVRGKWLNDFCGKGRFSKRIVQCSLCGNFLDLDGVNAGRGDANYCPNCGADMREEN